MVRDRDETETFDFQSETRSRPRLSNVSTRRDQDVWKLRLDTETTSLLMAIIAQMCSVVELENVASLR